MKRRNSEKRTWGLLIGSKRQIRQMLTGEVLPRDPNETLADDLLIGCTAIAKYSGLKPRTVYDKVDALGLKRLFSKQP